MAENTFLNKIIKLWEEGENQSNIIDENYKYYTGENYQNPADSFFIKEKRTPLNIIGQIVDAKHSATLGAQFSASVVPEVYTFSDMQSMKDIQDVADVLDKALKQVLTKVNNIDDISERVLRWGFIKRGATQVSLDTTDNPQGDIKIDVIDPRNLRYTKGAKSVKDLTMIAYSVDIDAVIAKRDYARLPDGSFDVEMCKKIDEASGYKSEREKGATKAIASYSVTDSAGLAYVRDSQNQGTGNIITVVVMFLFDGTLEVPKEGQSAEEQALGEEMKMMYPNGRIVMFVPDKDKNLILKDEPAPESFKSLGNIDFLLLSKFDGLDVKSSVENLIPIQERINGTIRKLRATVGGNINSVLFDERMRGVVEDNSFVNLPVVFVEGLGDFQPPTLNNGGIEQAMKLRELIESYKQDAYEAERVNRAWVTGQNQDNVQSGEHAEALNESAMECIRALQRNYKDFYVSMCEKVVSLILENYSEQRLVEIASGFNAKEYAMFDTETGQDGQEQKSIKFIDKAGSIARTIKIDPSWRFKVVDTSGTSIPRTRRESARLIEEVIANPIMQTGDIDMIEMYLRFKDVPNRDMIVDMLRKKQEEAAKTQPTVLEQLAKNPDLMKAWSDLFKALEGHPNAQGDLLKRAGLDPTTGTITSLPANLVTSKSQVKDLAIIAPQQVSENPIQAKFGHTQATDLEVITHTKNERPPEEAKNEIFSR